MPKVEHSTRVSVDHYPLIRPGDVLYSQETGYTGYGRVIETFPDKVLLEFFTHGMGYRTHFVSYQRLEWPSLQGPQYQLRVRVEELHDYQRFQSKNLTQDTLYLVLQAAGLAIDAKKTNKRIFGENIYDEQADPF